jgi:hypothetical protein
LRLSDGTNSKNGYIYFKEAGKWIDFSYTFKDCEFDIDENKYFAL